MVEITFSFLCFLIFCLFISIQGVSFPEDLQPNKWVSTPKGQAPSHCARYVPSGAHLSTDGYYITVKKPNGEKEVIEECDYSWRPDVIKASEDASVIPDNGLVAYASVVGNFNYYVGDWEVPANITDSSDTQIIYLSIGLENPTAKESMQPTLQWGSTAAGGGKFWSATVWWITPNQTAIYSDLVLCNSGETIMGTLDHYGYPNGEWEFIVQHGLAWTYIFIYPENIVSPESLALVGLQAFNMETCEDYPRDGSTEFYNLQLEEHEFPVLVKWQPNVPFKDCNHTVTSPASYSVTVSY